MTVQSYWPDGGEAPEGRFTVCIAFMTEEKKWPSDSAVAMDVSDDSAASVASDGLAPHAKEHLVALKSAGLSKLHADAVRFLRAHAKPGVLVAPGVVWSANSSEIPVRSTGNGSGRAHVLVRRSLPESSPPTTTTSKAQAPSSP